MPIQSLPQIRSPGNRSENTNSDNAAQYLAMTANEATTSQAATRSGKRKSLALSAPPGATKKRTRNFQAPYIVSLIARREKEVECF